MEINWYPGHMAKARRELEEQIRKADVVIEVCDARIPHSSRNPDLKRMCARKKSITVLGKSDLADPALTESWVQYYRSQGLSCISVDMNRQSKAVLRAIERETKDSVDRAMERGIRKTVRVMVAGVPNVGKSTLINRLNGQSVAVVGDKPGVTKNVRWVRVGPYLELMDSPGLLWPRLDDQVSARRLCYTSAIKDDVVDVEALTIHLLEDMLEAVPQRVIERYRLKDASLRGPELLEEVCRGRGFLMKGGLADTERACRVVLDEYRGGKLGRITLERPPQTIEESGVSPDAQEPGREAAGTDADH